MKKRSFLLPLAVSLAALAGGVSANATTAAPTSTLTSVEISPVAKSEVLVSPKLLVIERSKSNGGQFAGHYSHRSHSSHSSHRSHYSSR